MLFGLRNNYARARAWGRGAEVRGLPGIRGSPANGGKRRGGIARWPAAGHRPGRARAAVPRPPPARRSARLGSVDSLVSTCSL